ncbi:unnamed protein product [Closterium sp. NIES-53]
MASLRVLTFDHEDCPIQFDTLQPASRLPAPSPYTEQTGGLTERREPVSCPSSPVHAVRTGGRVPCPRPPPVPGTHHMALRPSSVPQCVPLPSPPASSLADGPDPESDFVHAASPTIPRLLATVITDPSFESVAASALVAELVDFAAAYCLDYATNLVAESESDCPPSVGGECALGTDVLEDRQDDFDLRWLVYGLCQAPCEWHDTLRTTLVALEFAPSTADTSLFLRTDTSLPLFYVLVFVDDLVFATADTEALTLVKSELQRRHTCTDLVGVRVSAISGETDWATAHRRFRHIVKQLEKDGAVKGLKLNGQPPYDNCEIYLLSKFTCFPFHGVAGRSKKPLELVHTHLVGLLPVPGHKGEWYFLTIVDDWIRLMCAYPLKQKQQAASTVKDDCLLFMEKQAQCEVKRIRIDRGGELLGDEMTARLKKQGIQRELTTAYTPQSNGVEERANRIILENS